MGAVHVKLKVAVPADIVRRLVCTTSVALVFVPPEVTPASVPPVAETFMPAAVRDPLVVLTVKVTVTALPGVTVTGFVDDVRDWLARAALCVAPLRIARGVQNKVLEAMAMGRAVVATPQAHEGIDAVPGRELLVADGVGPFADAVLGLLRERERAAAIGMAARACVERRYRWDTNLAVLDEVFA